MIEKFLDNKKMLSLQHVLREQHSVLVEGLWNSPKALIASMAQQLTGKHVLILTGASQEEIRLFHDFSFFTDRPVVDFPAWETLPSDLIDPSPDIVGERYKALREVSTSGQPHIILTGLQACLQRLILPQRFQELYLSLRVGNTYAFDVLIQKLVSLGYKRQAVASDKGEFAVRGGIIDIFPVSTPTPYRLEFWGDELESMRSYDPVGQKSVMPAESLEIPPALEMQLLKQTTQTGTILDYLGPQTLIIFDDLLALEDRYANLVTIGGKPSNFFSSIEDFLDQIEPLQKIYLAQQPIEELSEVHVLDKGSSFYSENAPPCRISFQMFNRDLVAHHWHHPFVPISNYLLPEIPDDQPVSGQEIIAGLQKLSKSEMHLYVLCPTELEEKNFQEKIQHAKIHLPHHTTYQIGYLSNGLIIPESNLMILPLTEITQRYKIRRQKQRSTYHTVESETYDLTPGEMIVHLNNGIGRFVGLEKRLNHNGVLSEFFQLEYANNAQLFVPINQAYLITKYVGSDEEIPKMHALGSSRWKHTRAQTERAILGYAKDLLDLYAHRSIKQGFVYSPDSPDMKAFEEDFAFEETEDQLEAIAAIKKDMTSHESMDRLVCGDVGYGKTEVSMRAAFKAVVDGHKQVAVLVPTTVLAMQHYETFVDRMSNFPINIGVLSRFRSAKEIRETLEAVAAGTIDILIGTHRIISNDVIFKDLGLVIIDEEQRFGVKAKEHLKKIKLNVDCLTLSATPIPRTLYMSLVKVREMSIISTPPQDRIPITTIIVEPHEQVIKNALLRELARDGQAFFIHNRVETIYDVADRLKKLLPQARIAVGHGQMHSDELDQVFHAFKNGSVDILVATTIVENGIDIPNANTILIDNSNHFGLADLYQLRGRVGRWNRRAYAYFLVRNLQRLPEISRKRLNALAESSGYGGGMKIAMRDLEIRGAGNLLGTEQSGHVAAIGFYLYCKLLKRAVQTFQGKVSPNLCDAKVEAYVDARLPEEYVNEASLRMEFYQRFGEVLTIEEVSTIWDELKDRFGPPPEPAQWLYYLTRLRIYGSTHGITSLKIEKLSLTIELRQGKDTTTRKILHGKILSPPDLEIQVLKALKSLNLS